MRGSPPSKDVVGMVAEATLMARYNQPYSEIRKMPMKKILFYLALGEAEDIYTQQQMEKQQSKYKKW